MKKTGSHKHKKRLKKSHQALLYLFLAAAVLLVPAVFKIAVTIRATSVPAVFLLPHQDDEMVMAGAIREHVLAGRPVHVVIFTDGGATGSRFAINGINDEQDAVYDSLTPEGTHQPTLVGKSSTGALLYRHFPDKEGYHVLTKKEITVARNKEVFSSLTRLGVPAANIHFANQDINTFVKPGENYSTGWADTKYIDGTLSRDQANEIINYYFKKYGPGSYKAVAMGIGAPYSDNLHPDHLAIYQAIHDFKGISDKRYYGANFGVSGVAKKTLTTTLLSKKSYALSSYYYWNPPTGRFAVGEHSVKGLLDTYRVRNYETVFADTEAPANISTPKFSAAAGKVNLSWQNPSTSDFYGVKIIRKIGSMPTSLSDGVPIYSGPKNTFTDTVIPGRTYYYKIFAYDTVYNYSSGYGFKVFSK
jgi:hypothetical protein